MLHLRIVRNQMALAIKKVRADVAANLRAARRRLGLSQEALALTADIDRAYLSRIERGLANPSLTTLAKLAHALQMPLDELVKHHNSRHRRT